MYLNFMITEHVEIFSFLLQFYTTDYDHVYKVSELRFHDFTRRVDREQWQRTQIAVEI